MKSKIEIGVKVRGSNGTGTITKIITKSTGYVEVTFDNGKVKKEMAFNLTDVNGEEIKSKPVHSSAPRNNDSFMANLLHAQICSGNANGIFNSIMESNPTPMAASIISYARTYMQVSEKQAYALYMFCKENNIEVK